MLSNRRSCGVFILWVMLMCNAGTCLSQEFVINRKISLNRGDTMVIAGIMTDVKIEKINPSVYYFWYGHGQILSNQGGHGGTLLHGDYVEYGPAGSLLLKGHFYKGTQSGQWNYWYPGGAIKESIQYENGLLEGSNIRYSLDGKIYFQANYHEALFHGKMTRVINDTLVQIRYWRGEEKKRKVLHVFEDHK